MPGTSQIEDRRHAPVTLLELNVINTKQDLAIIFGQFM